MRNDGHEELDQILDTALATYCTRQPWPGIEERVIARLPRPKPRHAWMPWAIPVPVLAGVLAMVAYWAKPEAPRVNVPQQVVQRTVPAELDAKAQPATAVARVPRLPRTAAQSSVTKAAVFPSPSPLTAEERALVQLAASHPAVLQNVHISQQHRNQPLTVEPINIPPLENSDSLED